MDNKNIKQSDAEISLKKEIAFLKQQLSEFKAEKEDVFLKNDYHSLYHNVPMGIMHYDKVGVILDCNEAFVNIIGSSRQELIGLDMQVLPNKKLVYAVNQSLLASEGRYEGIYKSVTSKKETPVKILFKGLQNEKNEIYGGICIAEDLTKTIITQKALKKTEDDYRLIFENTTDVFYRTNNDGAFLSLNPAAKDLLLLDNIEEAIGKNVIDFYANPSDRIALLDELEKHGEVHAYLLDLRRKDGSIITVELNSRLIYNKAGGVDSYVGVFHDVTNRLNFETDKSTHLWFLERLEMIDGIIRKSIDNSNFLNEILSTLIEAFQCDSAIIFELEDEEENSWSIKSHAKSDNYTCRTEPDSFINDSDMAGEIFNRISMYTELVVIDNSNIEEINELSSNVGVKAQMIMALSLNTGNSIILCVNHCKDDRIWNNHEKALFTEIANRISDAINTFESSELLYKSEEHHRSLIEATSEGYFEIDTNGIVIVANNALCNMLGYSLNEFINKPYSEFISIISKATIEKRILDPKNIRLGNFEVEFKHKRGNPIYTLCSATRIKSDNDNDYGGFFFVTDISNQKKIELELEELNQNLKSALSKAEESDKLKTLFIKNISHEIRTPLNGIIGFIEMLNQEDLTKEERKEFTSYVMASSNQLTTIISDILEFSKLEAGQVKVIPKEFHLNSLIDELYSEFNSVIITKNKTQVKLLSNKPLSDKESKISADFPKIKQVLISLISNAVKFTLKGQIEFGYKINNDGSITFFVADSGVGIPVGDKEIIFDKFRQGASTDSAVYGGNGLGLTISKSLTDLLGGKIWFESKVDKGTQFYFTVPITTDESKRTNKFPKLDWSDKKILIVDDILEVYQLLSIYLRDTKAKQLYAENGKQAIEFCKQNPDIDLVLLDIQLPDMDGYEIVKEIKSIRSELPVIAQTAFALSGDKERALQSGFNDYITKPIYKKTLLEHISKFF